MKKLSYVLVLVLALTALLISACGGSAAVSAPDSSAVGGGSKPQASPVEFTGVIESIAGNEWTVDGQKITVDPAVVRDGPFKVGDTVKVEVQVQTDGSMVVSRVEAPGADDNSNDANSNVNSNANSNDNSNVNSNDNANVNSNDDNSNVNGNDNSNVNSNDSNSNDDKSNDDNSNSGGDDSGGGGNSNDD
jgi:uncharacterized membrane protein YgcG